MALPARMALRDAESLVLASADPAIWLTASRHDVVTVQIDGVDADNHTWSVVAAGLASPASEGEVAEVLAEEVLRGAHLIEVPLSVVYGQRN